MTTSDINTYENDSYVTFHSPVTLSSGMMNCYCHFQIYTVKGKNKAVPLEAWGGPEGSCKLRFPDFMTTAQGGGKVVSLTQRPPLPPRKYNWYSFLLEAESTPGP